LPRLLFDLDWPLALLRLAPALPPPRDKFVPLGFFPELRFSPGLAPTAGPNFLLTDFFRCVMTLLPDGKAKNNVSLRKKTRRRLGTDVRFENCRKKTLERSPQILVSLREPKETS